MARNEKAEQGVFKMVIAGELTIFRAAELKQAIFPAVSGQHEIEIDLSRVTELDGAGLQLLIAAKNEAVRRRAELRFVGHSVPVTEAIDLFGLSAFFGDPIVISSRSA